MNEFITIDFIATFAGLVTGTTLVVQLLKYVFKDNLTDILVRPIVFVVALILTFIFAGDTSSIQGIILTLLNSFIITLTSSGAYEYIADPRAEKE